MPDSRVVTVNEGEAGERLDRFLVGRLPTSSRSAIQRWIQDGRVEVNGLVRRASYRVKVGDDIEVWPPPPREVHLAPEAIPISVLYEDEVIIVVNKPASLVVHPGAGHPTGTLANALLYHFRHVAHAASVRPGIVHRLDKDTSGVMVVAKTDSAHEILSNQFKDRVVEKTYVALVFGEPDPPSGEIDAPIGRHPKLRTRMAAGGLHSRPALTRFRVTRRFAEVSLLDLSPCTGRTHQIRVHLLSIGCPVVGDETYAGKRLETIRDPVTRSLLRTISRQFLHARKLAFLHPVSGEKVEFETPLPTELAELVDRLE